MSLADAKAFIAEAQAKNGVTPPARAAVTSVDQLLEILMADELGRFEDAVAFVEGKPGVDALTLHATLELTWSDAQYTVALLAAELGKRADATAARLEQQRGAGKELTPNETKQLEKAQQDQEFLGKAQAALEVLADQHLRAAGALVSETVRQFPRDARSYRVVAYYDLLTDDFHGFDAAMTWFKSTEAEDAGVQYLRALEAMRRFAVRKEARAFLSKALALNPKLVSAQAKLVFLQDGIEPTYAELQKLKTLAPRHPVVTIAGPVLTAEYELSASMQRAKPAAVAPAPAPVAPAPPAPPAPAAAPPAPAP